MNIRSLLFFVLLLSSLSFYAQKNNFNSFTVRNGLPHNTVYKIFQDSKGYLWLGTDGGGVSKFDGRKHTYFKKENGLLGNVVRDIIEDKNGKIWFATDEGISIYDGVDFQNISTKNGLISNTIFKIYEDSQGRIWAGSTGGGLSYISLKDSLSITNFSSEDGLSSDNVLSILEDNYNRLWLGFIGGPPQIIDFKNGKIIAEEIKTAFNYDLNAIFCGAKDIEGNIWFGSYHYGLFKFENIRLKSNPTIVNYSVLNGMKDNRILDICPQGNTLWVATNDGGVHYLKDNQIEYIDEDDGLPTNQVIDIFSDRESNLWFSCMGEGLVKLNGFEFSHYSEKDGLISNQTSYIKKNKSDSNIWVSSFGNGIQTFKVKGNELIEQQRILSDHPLYNSIKAFDFDAYNNVWIGTSNGVVVWNEEILATVGSDFIAGDKINAILCAKSGWAWIGTSSGLSVYNGDSYLVFTEDEGLNNNEIQTIIEGSDSTVWIGTLGGLASWSNGTLITYDEVEGLTNLKVHSLVEANNGNIIIGTYGGGLFYFDKSKDSLQIRSITEPNTLTSNNIYSLSFENENTLIVGTDNGADKIEFNPDFTVKSVQHFTENSGFLAIQNNLNAIYNDKESNTTFFGTVNGITTYQSVLENNLHSASTVILEEIKLFNQDIDWNKFAETDKNHFPINLGLPHNKNFISFSFSTIHFKNPKNISYEYRLVGLSEDWFNSTSSEIVFPGLEPNSYTFEVKSITENGIESNSYQFSFIITPPFYKTWWFYTSCILFISICIVVFIQLNLRRLKREKIILEDTVNERTKEVVEQKDIIEEKNQEIMDSITYAKGIQKAILPDASKLKKYFDDFFVLFNPKDIVSGDFYWAHEKNGKYYFMAADCTGHGVPGAIMSVIGHTCLESTLKHPKELNAGEFLDLLNQNVTDILLQSEKYSVKDGMDVSLCIYDPKTKSIEYAGANNPLYFIRKVDAGFSNSLDQDHLALSNDTHNLFEFKATKQPIGDFDHRTSFNTQTIEIEPEDTIYLFSDGYPDQFGGPKGKKYMYKPFKRYLLDIQDQNLKTQKEHLNTELNNWMNPSETGESYEQIDDILIFGVRFK